MRDPASPGREITQPRTSIFDISQQKHSGSSLDQQTLAVANLCVELLLGVSVVVSLAYHAAKTLGEAGLAPEPVDRITALRCHV